MAAEILCFSSNIGRQNQPGKASDKVRAILKDKE